MNEGYKFLFPYEKVPYKSRIIIYGAGKLGQSYLKQMIITKYCTVVSLADKNWCEYKNCNVSVCDPKQIHTYKFDFVIIALRAKTDVNELYDVLTEQGVEAEQIIYIGERTDGTVNDIKKDDIINCPAECDISAKGNVAINVMGGFGDYIVQKRLLESLVTLAPEIKIDIYCSRHKEFLEYLYSEMRQVNKISYNLGTRYESVRKQYNVAISMFGTGLMLRVDELNNLNNGISERLYLALNKVKKITGNREFDITKPTYIECYRSIYENENCINRLSFNGILPVRDKMVHIPCEKNKIHELYEMGLLNYITFNYGNGNTHNVMRVAKAWPKENFEEVIYSVKNKFHDIKIVQIGADGVDKLDGIDKYFLGKPFSFVTNVLNNSMLHVDIEGGMVHLASNLGTKCLVLFGPTQMKYYGYENNINIMAGDCHDCYGLYADVNKCARNMEKPECMYSITPEMVTEKIVKYLASLQIQWSL